MHSEWSWDAVAGSMERTCERAVEIGLPSLAFTEHADFTPWTLREGVTIPGAWRTLVSGNVLTPPAIDLDGYLECLRRCRDRFPGLRILSGVELGEPHRHGHRVGGLLASGEFDRVLASVHSVPVDGESVDVSDLYRDRPAVEAVRVYLAEVLRMIERFDGFEVLAHVDYAVRYWPAGAGPYDPAGFEDEHRAVLRALARSGKALEINTKVPLPPVIVRWWHQEGGRAVTFASDAHDPATLARGLPEASALAESCGFRPGAHPADFWTRR
ncbi:PHP domain-containing protein [Planomonospora venezuelensis]|uniref:Histidinol-phosphatase n=1 Tax=Planomonospora venezuelensis TaxID=1999 RepID=A0A841D5X3_PLAVE|nr:histidinol-phosphatase (PHP family) [Planomonospora venezuelensis]GIN03685.1 histidinol-phosphatase [Planomonospora venezuelensis]